MAEIGVGCAMYVETVKRLLNEIVSPAMMDAGRCYTEEQETTHAALGDTATACLSPDERRGLLGRQDM